MALASPSIRSRASGCVLSHRGPATRLARLPRTLRFLAEARDFSLASSRLGGWPVAPRLLVKERPDDQAIHRGSQARGYAACHAKSAKCISPYFGSAPAIILRAGAWTAHLTAIAAGR